MCSLSFATFLFSYSFGHGLYLFYWYLYKKKRQSLCPFIALSLSDFGGPPVNALLIISICLLSPQHITLHSHVNFLVGLLVESLNLSFSSYIYLVPLLYFMWFVYVVPLVCIIQFPITLCCITFYPCLSYHRI